MMDLQKKIIMLIMTVILVVSSVSSIAEDIKTEPRELALGESFTEEGQYSVEWTWCYVMGNKMNSQKSRYGYMKSKKDGSKIHSISYSYKKETSGSLRITLFNRTNQSINWLDHIKCTIVYNDVHAYDVIIGQKNPGQIAAGGKTDIVSIEAEETEPMASAGISCLFVIPKEARDSDKSLVAYIMIDNDVYSLDLRNHMKVMSRWGDL